jgi:hypothetical protein
MTFKDSIWKEDILNTNATTNTLSKDWKLWKKIFGPSRKLEKKIFYHLQIFYYTSLKFHLKFHLKLATMRKTLFETLETSQFQQLKEFFYFTHLKRSMSRKNLFHTFLPWNLILSKTWRNLLPTSHSLRNGLLLSLHPCKLKAFLQTQRPFFHTPQTFNESMNSLPHTFILKLDTFKKLKEQVFHTWKTYKTLKKSLPHLLVT